MFDIVIIGGNLSGSLAAINAARENVSVALIERHKEPCYPAHCGEGIADITADLLNLDEMRCPKNEIGKVIVNVSSARKYTFKLSRNKMYIINRTFLENELIKKAEEKGVEIFLGRRMKKFNPPSEVILDNNKKIYGKIIIDASGISCIIGKQIGVRATLRSEDVGVCIQSRVQSHFDPYTVYFSYHEPYAPFGYAWVFPKNEKEANVGIGVNGGKNFDLKKSLDNYLDLITNGSYKVIHTFRGCVPLALPLENLVENNVMFVGDAGRLADPGSAAGIHNAVFSGTLAGLIAGRYILGELKSLKVYQEVMKNKTDRLIKTYYNKSKLTTGEKYQKAYNRAWSILSFLNSIFPNFFQGYIAKRLKKDIKIINLFR